MRKSVIIVITLFAIVPFSKGLAIDPRLILKYTTINQFDSLKVCGIGIKYKGTFGNNLMFDIEISNNSKDTIRVEPNLFYYIPFVCQIDSAKCDSIDRIYSLNMEMLINDFKQSFSSNPTKRNPYSLTSKTTGELIQHGLITGTIATIFGMKYEDLDNQRKYDEEEWNRRNKKNNVQVQSKLLKWEKRILKVSKISPNEKVKGEIFFPIMGDANEIEVMLPIERTYYCYRYKQN